MADNQSQQGGPIDLRGKSGGNPAKAGSTGSAKPTKDQSVFERFDIPDLVKEQHPDLIPLIIQTESMNDDERQYWFHIIPIMNDEQVDKLREILVNEKKQLQAIDSEYEQELRRINDKHVAEWKGFQAKEKREKLKTAEQTTEKTEAETEEELLKKLQGF